MRLADSTIDIAIPFPVSVPWTADITVAIIIKMLKIAHDTIDNTVGPGFWLFFLFSRKALNLSIN